MLLSFVIFKRTCLNDAVLVPSNPNSLMNLIQFSVTQGAGVGLFNSQCCYCNISILRAGLQTLGLLLEYSGVEVCGYIFCFEKSHQKFFVQL